MNTLSYMLQRLNNLIVMDLALLRNSYLSLAVVELSLLVEGLRNTWMGYSQMRLKPMIYRLGGSDRSVVRLRGGHSIH